MADSFPAPDGMIVLAGEQLWPNLHGLAHWADSVKLLCICEAAQEERSAEAARRLENLCRSLHPGIQVERATPAGAAPEAIEKQVQAWRDQFPGKNWLINASGGTKLMFAGILPFVGQPGLTVVFRDPLQEWSILKHQSNGPAITLEPLHIPAEGSDRIPVRTLIEHVWSGPGEKVECGKNRPRLDILKLTQQGIHDRWNWPRTFEALGYVSDEHQGMGFEDFIAQVLMDLGVANLATNAQRILASGQVDQKIDVVANYRGRVLLLDCNLDSGEREKITMPIRYLAQARRVLGGLEARGCLLRPLRPIHPNLHALAEELGLRILDVDQAGHFFSQLARWVGQPTLPAGLAQAEALLQEALANRTIDQVFVPSAHGPSSGRGPRPPAPASRAAPAVSVPATAASPSAAVPHPSPSTAPAPAPVPLDPAYREKVKVRVLGPLDQGNLVGLYVQEEGKPRGILAYGIRPDQLPRAEEQIEVYRNNLDAAPPQYRWDPMPGGVHMPGRGRGRGRRGGRR